MAWAKWIGNLSVSKMSQLDQSVREIVFASLTSAAENGYFKSGEYLDGATAEEIADDMLAFAPDCEAFNAEMLLPYIREWLAGPGSAK
jgi:hypothetical protein